MKGSITALLSRFRYGFAFGLIAIILAVAPTSPAYALSDQAKELIKFALEVRRDHRVTHGTWLRFDALARNQIEEGKAIRSVVFETAQEAWNAGEITLRQYQQFANLAGRIETNFEQDARVRRIINGRQASRARKSINRNGVARLFGLGGFVRKRVYTYKRAQQALDRSTQLQQIAARRKELVARVDAAGGADQSAEQGESASCPDAEKQSLANQIDALNSRWADRWCKPHAWSGCGAPPLDEANSLRAALARATTQAQCDWVAVMASCKDDCMMGPPPGDAGAAERLECLRRCGQDNPWPE